MSTDNRRIGLVFLADVVVLMVFAAIGRQSHNESNQLLAIIATGMPFVVSWLVVSALTGLYRQQSFKRWIVWTLAWAPLSNLLALALRSLWLGKPVLLTFTIVSMCVTTLFLVLVRVLFSLRGKSAR